MPGSANRGARPPCAQGAPRAAAAPRVRSAAPKSLSRPAEQDFAYREHQRHVAALYDKLVKVKIGVEWQQKRQHERAMTTGRAVHTTGGSRRRDQRALARENEEHMRRLRRTEARFATPEEIAMLTGKPIPGAAAGAAPTGGTDD